MTGKEPIKIEIITTMKITGPKEVIENGMFETVMKKKEITLKDGNDLIAYINGDINFENSLE